MRQYDKCIHCGRPYSEQEKEERQQLRAQNAKNSRDKAKLNGNKLGAKMKIDRRPVIALRSAGFSLR
jgi:hypothetical protein